MKYKVMFNLTSGSGNRSMANAEFYVKEEAISACEAWREIGTGYFAILWDGSTWTKYEPIP